MININLTDVITNYTNFWNTVFSQDGLVKNTDGTISVYILNSNNVKAPQEITKIGCETLNSITNEGYYYDLNAQKCRWSITNITSVDEKPLKIVLNPEGNDGVIFNVDEVSNDTYSLFVEFDYLLKFNCEKFSELISPTKPINPLVFNKINDLKSEISNEEVKLETIQLDLGYYKNEFENLTYSIECNSFPIQEGNTISTSENITPTVNQISPFNKTAFNSVTSFGIPSFSNALSPTKEVTFCLTEPIGLETWSTILGTRYQSFLDGDTTSYTCNDVITLYNTNSVNVLLYECNTPFGTKTNVNNKIIELEKEEIIVKSRLLELQSELNTIILSETNVCDTPIGVLETMDVSLSIDIVDENGNLTSVYDENIFPMVGFGQLYKYLTDTGDNSGFFVCGSPNTTETWTSGCTGLNFSGLTSEEKNVKSCDDVYDYFLNELYTQSGLREVEEGLSTFKKSLTPNTLSSNWIKYSGTINNENIINRIKNEKIKLSLNINSSCGDFCVLIDNISLDKIYERVERDDIFITKSPGFDLTRVIDNKKSWVNNSSLTSREFLVNNPNTNNNIRQTIYDINDERLIINTKEIDLDINIAKAIEYDVFSFIIDNPCLFTPICTPCEVNAKTFQDGIFFKFQNGKQYDFEGQGSSDDIGCCVEDCNPCIKNDDKTFQDDECFIFMDDYNYDFQDGTKKYDKRELCCGDNTKYFDLITTDLNTVTNIEMFEVVISSELIDAKNRQTISSYPTLKALYERYLNSYNVCGVHSSKYKYDDMDKFAGLIGDYWVDIIEQVVPATTIWGSVKIYTNSVFDQQKFKYKAYSSLFCENEYIGLNKVKGINCNGPEIEVITTSISQTQNNELQNNPKFSKCNRIYMVQMNSGSEFIGTVKVIGLNGNDFNSVTEIII